MKQKRNLKRIRGWLPKESVIAYAREVSKPRWKLHWKMLTLSIVLVASLIVVAFVGVQTYGRYSNPQMDLTTSYFEKTINCTTTKIGDFVEVSTTVYWHGYVVPVEFKREVKIADPVFEGNFAVANGTSILESTGYGGTYILRYTLRVTGGAGTTIELPRTKLTLDDAEIPLSGTSPTLTISAK
jgi:hypothetical protein